MSTIDFNPNRIGQNNGHFIGLPFLAEEAKVVVISVPWDVTVSYSEGTSNAPENILMASLQLDLYDPEILDAWKLGVFVQSASRDWLAINRNLRPKARAFIDFIERGGDLKHSSEMNLILNEINIAGRDLNKYVYLESKKLLEQGKLAAVLGGEHSSPLGLMKALKEKYGAFGVLHIDAHMDLRKSYEGFTYSHASIFNNAVNKGYVENLVQVGIRDNCEEEVLFASQNNVKVFYDADIKSSMFRGESWHNQCEKIISSLPKEVYISFDIDGLNPHLCPNTGTPVPGGIEYSEAIYLIKELVRCDRKIIGFDLCEVGGENEWDGNVGARILYNLCNWAGRSQGWI